MGKYLDLISAGRLPETSSTPAQKEQKAQKGPSEGEVPLTPELIARYSRLSPHDRQLLLGFAAAFPGSRIEWIKTDKGETE